MEKKNKKQTGHATRTYRVRLYDRHFGWIKTTFALYEKVVGHFFEVLKLEEELLVQSDFNLLRTLEIKCIGTKEMKAAGKLPEHPMENFPKVPLYFRRSAINTAIDLARKKAKTIQPNMVLYKGMYQNFTDKTIELKLFNGEKWLWVMYPFYGRSFPPEAERLSPLLVLEKKAAWMEVPLSFSVEDIRTVKERMEVEEKICALAFPDQDALATAVLLDKAGKELACKFFRGGKQKEEQRRRVLERIVISEESRGMGRFSVSKPQENVREKQTFVGENAGKPPEPADEKIGKPLKSIYENVGNPSESVHENAALYAQLREINRHYAHSISHQILDYCTENNIKVVVVPNYEDSIDFNRKKYLNTDIYRWLGRSIIKNLKYKAFGQGIVVTSVRPYHISGCCSECGAKIRKYNEGHAAGQNYYGGRLFLCPNGHKGNSAENAAKNVGKSFLSYYK